MKALEQRSTGLIALVAAILLVLHSSLAGWAAAAMSGQTDAFGNPLCITSSDHAIPAGGDHTGLVDCCTMGCASAFPVFHAPGDATPVFLPVPADDAAVAFDGWPGLDTRDHNPGHPRAPPRNA